MVDGNGHDQFECNITAFILRDVSQNIFFFFLAEIQTRYILSTRQMVTVVFTSLVFYSSCLKIPW